jgi:hypothetical protein
VGSQLPTACFCNGALTSWFKVLSSFNVWFRGTGRGFDKAPLQKHKRWQQAAGQTDKLELTNEILPDTRNYQGLFYHVHILDS